MEVVMSDRVNDIANEVKSYRHELHQNPQTSYEEEFASKFIQKKLSEWNIPFEAGIAVTGIVATIEGHKNNSGKCIGVRADIDALDICECSGQPWMSKNEGKMHACGHDGHTAIMLGVAKYLSEFRDFDGVVHLIFQPAEEGGRGAFRMIEEGLFERFPCDMVFGLHNWPALPKGKLGMCVGPIMAGVDEFHLKVKGKGGHAAMPHDSRDPIVAASALVQGLQTIVSRNVDPAQTSVISVTNFHGGTGAFNIIPSEVKLSGTVRTLNSDVQQFIKDRITAMCLSVGDAYNVAIEVEEYIHINGPTVNTADGIDLAIKAGIKAVGTENVLSDIAPSMAGEDFAAMLEAKPGAYIFLGQGESDENSPHSYGLHHPKYDFNDEVIPIGISYFVNLVETYLS